MVASAGIAVQFKLLLLSTLSEKTRLCAGFFVSKNIEIQPFFM
jgi:hypothetical protein